MLLVSIRWLGTIVLLGIFTGRGILNDLPAIGRNLGYVYLMGTIGLGGFGTLIYYSAYTTSAVNIGIAKHRFDSMSKRPRRTVKKVEQLISTADWAILFRKGKKDARCAQRFEDELDDELILDSMQEILNMVLGAAVRIIGKTYPVKLCLPRGGQNCGIPYDTEAQHQFRVEMKTRDWVFPMLVTVRPPSQQAAA